MPWIRGDVQRPVMGTTITGRGEWPGGGNETTIPRIMCA